MSNSPVRKGFKPDGTMCSEDEEGGRSVRRKILSLPLTGRRLDHQTVMVIDAKRVQRKRSVPLSESGPLPPYVELADSCVNILADWPRLYSGTYTLLGAMFRKERIRYEVAVLVTSAVMNSLHFHHLRDPTFEEFGLGRETFAGLTEARILEVFKMDKWSESYYRRWLESPVREELLSAGYLVPRPGQTAGEVTQLPESIPMDDEEWKAIRIWCHYLWFLLRAQAGSQ